jgi:hypothetical protein
MVIPQPEPIDNNTKPNNGDNNEINNTGNNGTDEKGTGFDIRFIIIVILISIIIIIIAVEFKLIKMKKEK